MLPSFAAQSFILIALILALFIADFVTKRGV
jgi:hypothetical protein